MQRQYCLLLIAFCFFYYVQAQAAQPEDWFVANLPQACTGPRIRRSWSDLTLSERDLFLRVVLEMQKYPAVGATDGAPNLYAMFVRLHNGGSRVGWHDNVNFAYAHKALLYSFESALIYVAQMVGDKMNPPVSKDDACKISLPYIQWEKFPGSLLSTADFWSPDGLGSCYTDPNNNYYVADGVFKDQITNYETCFDPRNPSSCGSNPKDRKLKRWFLTSNAPNRKISEIMNEIFRRRTSRDFVPYITGTLHNGMHVYVGFSMGRVTTAGDDILFWLHHCNVDRFLHFWADCHGYDKIDPVSPQHYDTTPDSTGRIWTLDTEIQFSPPYWNLKTPFGPTARSLWTLGTATKKGWNNLYYRYGDDSLANNIISAVCPDKDWTFVNYKSPKRSTTVTDDSIYDEASERFIELTENQGMSAEAALQQMAMEDCLATPTDMSDEAVKARMSFSHHPETPRICEAPTYHQLEAGHASMRS